MKTLSIIIPVYYNAESLPILYEELVDIEKKLLERKLKLELIFVDDGSGDDSFERLLQIKKSRPNTRIVKLTRNFGVVQASKKGCSYATGDCFMILAADLQDPTHLILELVEHWEKGSKFVICCRSTRDDPWLSKLFAKCYYKLIHIFVDKTYPAGGFDLALMDKSLLSYLVNSNKNIYTPSYMYWLGFKPAVIFYHRCKRVYGHSRWSFGKKITACLDSILGFSILPIRIISIIGIFVSIGSLTYGLSMIISTILGHTEVKGFATIASLISLLLGLIIIMLGIIGEYLWRTFDSVNGRPEAVIDEVF